MGLLGKLLAIFNLLAVVGFLVVVVMDYGKQRAWSTLLFQQTLLKDGLPVDDTETDADGEVTSKKIGAFTLQQLLTSDPVTTQTAEVRKRQNALQQAIDQAGDDEAKRRLLAQILIPLATSFGDREDLKKRIAAEPIDQLMGDDGPFKAAFREALEGKTTPKFKDPAADGAPTRNINRDLRKQAIAHLLFNAGEKPANYDQRLQGVIGLTAFLEETTSQEAVNKQLLLDYQEAIRNQSLAFENKHRDLIQQIVASAERLQDQREVLQKQENSRDSHRALVGKRREDLAVVQAQVESAQKQLERTIARQKELESALQTANQDAERASEANKALERQIRSLELGR